MVIYTSVLFLFVDSYVDQYPTLSHPLTDSSPVLNARATDSEGRGNEKWVTHADLHRTSVGRTLAHTDRTRAHTERRSKDPNLTAELALTPAELAPTPANRPACPSVTTSSRRAQQPTKGTGKSCQDSQTCIRNGAKRGTRGSQTKRKQDQT